MSDIFALPDAKRVRREDLYDSDHVRDSSPDENEAEAETKARLLNARLSALLSLNLDAPILMAADGDDHAAAAAAAAAPPPDESADQPDEAPEFEFRLFSTSSVSQKVVLAPLEDKHVQAEIVSQRPLSYYLRGDLTPQERERFQYAAVSGRDVMQWAHQRAWGLEVPWRVTKITLSSPRQTGGDKARKKTATGPPAQDSAMAGAKKRPGKKRRIALRVKEKAEKEAAATLAMKRMTKEEHLKEKKKRLNREKKLKRRKKEKEKKLGGGSAAAADGGDHQSESDDNDMES
ncbi:hypothetical protein B0T22DRAFT_465835 [Podospora appendiculata]|uniref:Uncharacterized protein n=1 Tax=Podospora appendiculata TaxID=314037 RepID=A0AAE1CAH1_9PEZI|nr:hypothetical protein B0T22DRAFT_465835 [Podospora appendiculata]